MSQPDPPPNKQDSLDAALLQMFVGCETKAQMAECLFVALSDTGTTASQVNRVYHSALDAKGWR